MELEGAWEDCDLVEELVKSLPAACNLIKFEVNKQLRDVRDGEADDLDIDGILMTLKYGVQEIEDARKLKAKRKQFRRKKYE